MRGEYFVAVFLDCLREELPPRARRILKISGRLWLVIGTTSACAENTYVILGRRFSPRNYLRVRGEYHQRYNFRGIEHGTTSACAENTVLGYRCVKLTGNYLRVRGEYVR